jgi:P27 family predicted phage terminase small subunit
LSNTISGAELVTAARTSTRRLPSDRPPRHLTRESAALWRAILRDYILEPHHRSVLSVTLEALDRLRDAQALLKTEGLVVKTSTGGSKAHPAIAVERDCRAAFLRGVRELGLDLEGPTTPRLPSRWRE